MSQVLGVGSAEAPAAAGRDRQADGASCRIRRAVLVNNPDLLASHAGHQTRSPDKIIADTTVGDHRRCAGRGARRSAPPPSATRRSSVGAILLVAADRHPGGAVAGPSAAHAARQRAARSPTRTWPARSNRCVPAASPGPVEPIPVHTSEEVGQVAHAVDELHEQAVLAGRRAVPAAAAGRRHVRDAVAAQPIAGRPAAVAHRPARTQRGGPRAAGEPVPPRPPGRPDAPQRRQPAGARRREGASRAGRAGAGLGDHQRRGLRGRGLHPRGHRDGARQRDRGVRRRRPGAPAGRTARQRAALLAADLAGAGVGGAHRQRRPRHRGQRHRPRHDRVGSAGGQHPPAVRRRGQPLHRPAHGSVRGRPARRTARAGGPAAQHHCGRTEFGHHRRCVRARRAARPRGRRPTSSASRSTARPPMRTRASRPRWRSTRTTPTAAESTTTAAARSTSTATPRCRSRCCRSAIPAPAGSPTSRRRWRRPSPRSRASGPTRSSGPPTRCRRRRPSSAPVADAARAPPQARPTRPAFFASRAQAAGNGVPSPRPNRRPQRAAQSSQPEPAVAREPSATAGSDDAIYQKMLSEWLVDPTRPGQQRRPELGVGVGSRLVGGGGRGGSAGRRAHRGGPAGARARRPAGARHRPTPQAPTAGITRNGGAHRSDDGDDEVASAAEFDAGGAASRDCPAA